MRTEVLIRARPEPRGGWFRYHGVSIDEPLLRNFWIEQPDKVVRNTNVEWYKYIYVDLLEGEHFLEYRNSEAGNVCEYWSTNVAINGSLKAEDVHVDINNPLRVDFVVGEEPPPPPPPSKLPPIALGAAIGGTVGYASTKRMDVAIVGGLAGAFIAYLLDPQDEAPSQAGDFLL